MKCKLLVAEDELIERKVLCKTLQKYLGDLISLYEAKNGREAMELFAREAPGWKWPARSARQTKIVQSCS